MLPTAIKHPCPGLFYDLCIFLASSFGKWPAGPKDCGCVGSSVPAAHEILKVVFCDCDLQVRTWEVGKKPELCIFTSRQGQVKKMPASSCLSLPRGTGLKVKAEPHLGREFELQINNRRFYV